MSTYPDGLIEYINEIIANIHNAIPDIAISIVDSDPYDSPKEIFDKHIKICNDVSKVKHFSFAITLIEDEYFIFGHIFTIPTNNYTEREVIREKLVKVFTEKNIYFKYNYEMFIF